MGDPKFPSKKYRTPKKPWDQKLLAHEKGLRETYGLRNKKEIRVMEALVRMKRKNAKNVLALPLEKRAEKEKELLNSLTHMGVMRGKSALQDVLSLSIEAFLERRLQTIVWRKNLSNSIKQARQFITHGHIGINGKKISVPSYLVAKEDETTLGYYGKPPVLQSPQKKQKDKKQLAKDFAEMAGEPQGTETKLMGEEMEAPITPDAADAQREETSVEEGK